MSEPTMKTCNKCKKHKELSCFVGDREQETKTCDSCRKKYIKYNNKRKCDHGIVKSYCKECGGGHICEHNKRRSKCIDCKGGSICEHNKRKSRCKDCGGSSICEHNRNKYTCKECKGGCICKHGKRRTYCTDCGGGAICEHKKIRSKCRDCGGGSICDHGRERTLCGECGGGCICEHNKLKWYCKECDGSQICEHHKIKFHCKICEPIKYLYNIARARIYKALKGNKTKPSIEYLECSSEELKKHLEEQFVEGMTWENYGSEWHVDHIIPLMYENPTIEEVAERLHYKNTQPLWASENISKGNRYIG